MRCEKCEAVITGEEVKELHRQILCEDCYMDLLSPVSRGCGRRKFNF